jgi:hypothetical protein
MRDIMKNNAIAVMVCGASLALGLQSLNGAGGTRKPFSLHGQMTVSGPGASVAFTPLPNDWTITDLVVDSEYSQIVVKANGVPVLSPATSVAIEATGAGSGFWAASYVNTMPLHLMAGVRVPAGAVISVDASGPGGSLGIAKTQNVTICGYVGD